MTGNRSQLMKSVNKLLGTVRFGNDHIAKIMRYDDYQLGNVNISRVYYVEGLGHNLFSAGQFCDVDLEVAFWKNTCFIRNLEACALGKGNKSSHQPKAEDTNQEKLYNLHMDLCGQMRVASINGKTYIQFRTLASFNDSCNIQFMTRSKHCFSTTLSSTKRDDWDHLFQPMFDEYFNPSSMAVSPVQEAPALRAVILADSLVSTSIDQDAPTIRSSSNVRQTHTPFEHLGRWTKDHPIANIIGNPSRFVSIRKQLQNDVMCCYFDAFLTPIEPNNFKQAITELSWIDAMQKEIHEFERLQVWKLVPCLDKVMLIKLKWIYKVKTNEFDGATRIFVANAASKNMKIFQMDVKTTFLNGELKKEVTFLNQKDLLIRTTHHMCKRCSGSNTLHTDSKKRLINGDKLISWSSKKQKCTAISSTEAEYIAVSGCYAQILWMHSHLTDYGFQFNKIPLYCDNKSAIALRCNNVQHSRAKHIDVRYHFIKERLENAVVELYFVRTEYQLADIFTKPLPRERFNFLIDKLGESGDGVNTQSKVPDEKQQKVSGTNKGAGVITEVSDVPKYDPESEEESWTFSQDEEDAEEELEMNDDSEKTESDNDRGDLIHPNFSTYKADDQEEEEEKVDDEEVSSDQRVSTPPDYELSDEEENKEGDDKDKEVQQQSSSVSSDLVSNFINTSLDTGIDSILNQNTQSDTLVNVPFSVTSETPSSITTIPQPPILNIQTLQQTPDSTTTTTTTTTNPTMNFLEISNISSLFQFDQRVYALEAEMSEFRRTSQFTEFVSLILGIVDTNLASKMKEVVDVAVQLQSKKLKEEAQAENQEFLNQADSTINANQGAVAASLSEFELKKILIEKIETNKLINRPDIQKDLYNALVESYNTDKDIITSYGDVVTLKEDDMIKIRMKTPPLDQTKGQREENQAKKPSKSAYEEEHDQKVVDSKAQPHQEFNTGNDDVASVREALNNDECQWNPSSSLTPNREWHKTKTVDNRPPQPWITQIAQATGTQSLFNEFLASSIDFSAFIRHRLKIDNLT
uniref:Copia protein n=1 Tax=Tanacetum cinerariifolium TaxID=118510 RepID=A0A6L2KIP3_TANCI|nr:copia protein [Tanacetum cinerariifolium]